MAWSSPRDRLRTLMARLAHDGIWAHWMRYMFSKCIQNQDGSVTIPSNLVERWVRQAATDFDNLSTKEQDSDYEQADKMIAIVWDAGWRWADSVSQEWADRTGFDFHSKEWKPEDERHVSNGGRGQPC